MGDTRKLKLLKKMKLFCADFAHYYLGCRYRYTWRDNGEFVESIMEALFYGGTIMAANIGPNKTGNHDKDWYEVNNFKDHAEGEFQLFLTHPCDLTNIQKREYKGLCYKMTDLNNKQEIIRYADTPWSMDYLFKNGIDAFDLIENGNAIDINTI